MAIPSARKALGTQGEQQVALYLQQKGYTILDCNVSWRGGEIDIIAQQGTVIAFVEVKTRKNSYFPLSSVVTPSKQRKIALTAQRYRNQHNYHQHVLRFDIALVECDQQQWVITHIPNAFSAPENIW